MPNYSIVSDSFEDLEASGDIMQPRDILDKVSVEGEDTADQITIEVGETFTANILVFLRGGFQTVTKTW